VHELIPWLKILQQISAIFVQSQMMADAEPFCNRLSLKGFGSPWSVARLGDCFGASRSSATLF